MTNRFDIQFMRGVAVLAVVAFHAFPGVLGRGYLGVDVFFVISGFLITRIILKGLESPKGFSFREFYARRAKRLLPAFLLTLAVTSVLALAILTRSQQADFAEQAVGSLAFVSNVVLAGQTGYFEGAAETKPLLHIWSLSLEEQFYFVAPFVLLWTQKRFRPWLLLAGFVASLALCIVLMTGPSWLPFSSKGAHKLAFFMPFTRAWELLAGSLCAWIMLRRPALTVPAWLKYTALATIPLVCIVGVDPVHPRGDALIVVVATAIILLGRDGWLPDMRATQPIKLAGDCSYSFYLIHWPLFSFAFILYGGSAPVTVMLGLAALSFGLGWLQYKWVELPLKEDWKGKRIGRMAFVGTMGAGILALAVPTMGATSQIAAQLEPTQGLAPSCDEGGSHWIDRPECRTSETPTVALWGDSYAMHLVPGLEGVPFVQMTKSACAPVEGLAHVSARYTASWARECVTFNESVLTAIETMPSVRVVIISSPFGQVLVGDGQRLLIDGRTVAFSDAGQAALSRAVSRLRAAGKTAIVVGPTPRAGFDAGRCNERMIEGRMILGRTTCDIDGADPENAAVRTALRSTGLEVASPGSVLCATGRCITRSGDALLYQDNGHLTAAGARYVADGLEIRQRVAGEAPGG